MKTVVEIARQPRDRSGRFIVLTGLVSFCMATFGCGDRPQGDPFPVSQPKPIPLALPASKSHQPLHADEGTVEWRGVDSGYYHITNGN
jgi:hypothetical protein